MEVFHPLKCQFRPPLDWIQIQTHFWAHAPTKSKMWPWSSRMTSSLPWPSMGCSSISYWSVLRRQHRSSSLRYVILPPLTKMHVDLRGVADISQNSSRYWALVWHVQWGSLGADISWDLSGCALPAHLSNPASANYFSNDSGLGNKGTKSIHLYYIENDCATGD